MAIQHMRITCWIPKATNTHSQYVILTAFPLQQWVIERVNVRLYFTYIASLFISVDRSVVSKTANNVLYGSWTAPAVCCCADFQGSVLSLFFIHVQWGQALCPSYFRCCVHSFEHTFSRKRISVYTVSSVSLADVSLPVLIYPQSTLSARFVPYTWSTRICCGHRDMWIAFWASVTTPKVTSRGLERASIVPCVDTRAV